MEDGEGGGGGEPRLGLKHLVLIELYPLDLFVHDPD